MLHYLAPYEFYIEVVAFCAVAVIAYARGLVVRRREGLPVHAAPAIGYFVGVILVYAVMHTWLDYLSQYMFWVHRTQHLVLHHLGPFLIVLGRPHEVLPHALPPRARARGARILRHPLVRLPYRIVQQPVIASVLFVGLIYFWLTPAIHFDAMLSNDLYRVMNGSMVVDGLLFWWLIVDPRGSLDGGLAFGTRILMLWMVMIPQIAIGAYIGLHGSILYDVYAVCGRAWPISGMLDQRLGGLITWIPGAMMSVLGALVVFRHWLRESERAEARRTSTLETFPS